MADITQPPTTHDEFERVDRLKLDLRNPRAPDEQFSREDEVLEYLLNFVDLNELIQSILSGRRNEPAVIRSQNPDLNRLVAVLGNDNARSMLESTRDLAAAYDQVEDKHLKFSQTLMATIRDAEETLKLVPHFDGRGDLMSAGDNLRRTVSTLHAAMKRAHEQAEAGDDADAD